MFFPFSCYAFPCLLKLFSTASGSLILVQYDHFSLSPFQFSISLPIFLSYSLCPPLSLSFFPLSLSILSLFDGYSFSLVSLSLYIYYSRVGNLSKSICPTLVHGYLSFTSERRVRKSHVPLGGRLQGKGRIHY